jgi:hypothetical protein
MYANPGLCGMPKVPKKLIHSALCPCCQQTARRAQPGAPSPPCSESRALGSDEALRVGYLIELDVNRPWYRFYGRQNPSGLSLVRQIPLESPLYFLLSAHTCMKHLFDRKASTGSHMFSYASRHIKQPCSHLFYVQAGQNKAKKASFTLGACYELFISRTFI